MTYRQLYLNARQELTDHGIDSPGTDTCALTEHFFGLDRPGLALHGEESPLPRQEAAFLQAVEERAARRPLQYILGSWEFMGLSLKVGEGVLCPREDTAVLVEALANALREIPSPAGIDLCAGTGAVALGLCSLLPHARAACLELSPQAFSYLEQNLSAYPQYELQAVQGDLFSPKAVGSFPLGSLDFIASNPPYIKTEALPSLQPEVQREPALALDGGADGLLFYRAICRLWLPLLKPGGVLAVEIGEEQGKPVSRLFSFYGFRQIAIKQDLAGLDRCVIGRKPS